MVYDRVKDLRQRLNAYAEARDRLKTEIASKDALLDDLESAVEEAQEREAVLVEALTEMLAVRAYVRGTRKTQANKQARKALANTEKETR